MNKNDVLVLTQFAKDKQVNELRSYSVAEIQKALKNQFSHTKIRGVIRTFMNYGYLKTGFKQGKASTYYITSKGIKFLSSLDKGFEIIENKQYIVSDNNLTNENTININIGK